MNLFYAHPDDIKLPDITVRDQEAQHITKVLRHQTGDTIHLTDGVGNLYHCEIKQIRKSIVDLSLLNKKSEERAYPLVSLCMGNIKNRDRMEFAVEKATELGVDRIIIFRGDHSQKGKVRRDRIESTVLSAMKQSLRLFLPEIQLEESLMDALLHQKEGELLLMADETTVVKSHTLRGERPHFLIIGPEGGFSQNERKILKKKGVIQVSLGSKRLRAETAAIIMVDRFKKPT
jgi:16S rRNA (uracil1498-N3)-methyltransferase